MPDEPITRRTIEDYLHDALPPERAAAVEKAVRDQPALVALVAQVRSETDRGEHSVGAVWWRERLTCPTREQLSMFQEDILDADYAAYVVGHVKLVGCHVCQATLDDLRQLRDEAVAPRTVRRKRIVDSSAGLLRDATR
jgi:anti-sigma factor RsiW